MRVVNSLVSLVLLYCAVLVKASWPWYNPCPKKTPPRPLPCEISTARGEIIDRRDCMLSGQRCNQIVPLLDENGQHVYSVVYCEMRDFPNYDFAYLLVRSSVNNCHRYRRMCPYGDTCFGPLFSKQRDGTTLALSFCLPTYACLTFADFGLGTRLSRPCSTLGDAGIDNTSSDYDYDDGNSSATTYGYDHYDGTFNGTSSNYDYSDGTFNSTVPNFTYYDTYSRYG